MRFELILLFLIFSLFSNAQTLKRVFVIQDYNKQGIITKERVKQIDSIPNDIDLFFFQEKFAEPLNLPDKFIDEGYANDTITTYYSKDGSNNKSTEWTTTCIYDSLSRVVSFSYSGCFVCTEMPYNYKVVYNVSNKPIRLINIIDKDEYEIIYNTNGEILQLKKFQLKKLLKTIGIK